MYLDPLIEAYGIGIADAWSIALPKGLKVLQLIGNAAAERRREAVQLEVGLRIT
jgi:hypothetical protein